MLKQKSRKTPNNRQCGASLLFVNNDSESDIVLTAAHCFAECFLTVSRDVSDKSTLADYYVVAGKHDLDKKEEGEQQRPIQRVKCNPSYRPKDTWKDDIAVIKLNKPIRFSKTIQPIKLPEAGDQIRDATVAGWGAVSSTPRGRNPKTGKQIFEFHYDSKLRHAFVIIENDTTCLNAWMNKAMFSPGHMICAGTTPAWRVKQNSKNREATCGGDSGSPLMYNFKKEGGVRIAGVLSFGVSESCNGSQTPDVYTEVSAYTDWIKKTIGELSSV
jgi:transmembrane serine protease 3